MKWNFTKQDMFKNMLFVKLLAGKPYCERMTGCAIDSGDEREVVQ
jgi:hypothetical protein